MRDYVFDVAGERLREMRLQRGKTLAQMGAIFRIDGQALGAIERGRRNPSLHLLIAASEYFGCRLGYLTDNKVEGIAS